MKAEELLQEFNAQYGGYICIDEDVVVSFLSSVNDERLQTAENLYDWVLANDMAYEVVE